MRRFAIVYATVAMVEPSQQQLTGMVVATVRRGWQQSHAGIQLLPGFWGVRGCDRTPLWPFVASPAFGMAVSSLEIGLAAPTGSKSSTDAFSRREARAEPERTAKAPGADSDAALAPPGNSQEERPFRAASSRHGTSLPRPSPGSHKKTRPWRAGLNFRLRKKTSKNSQSQHTNRILRVSCAAVFRKRFARPLHKEIEHNDFAIYG
jgi:hypothetical protein